MKIVLDTNIYLSALLFQGKIAALYDKVMEEHDVVISPFILAELKEKLIHKFKIPVEEVSAICDSILLAVTLIEPDGKLPDHCRDKDDNHILHLAETVQADYIISGDKDLWVLGNYQKTLIVRPADFDK